MPKHQLTNPSRSELSEQTFRKYEHIFVALLKTYPAPYQLTPASGALSTLVVRLREAANAVLANSDKFEAPLYFPLEEFRFVWSKVMVSIRGDFVVIAERGALAEISKALILENQAPKSFVTFSNPTVDDLTHISIMLLRGCHPGPILFTETVPLFTPPVGIAFEKTPDGWMML